MAKNEGKVQVLMQVPEVVVEKVEKVQEVVVVEPISKDKRVKIRTKVSFRQYIGNKWWDFVAGEERLVPEYVKEMLQERGALDVL